MNTTQHRVMHLVDDEVVTVPVRRKSVPFRMRIWRQKRLAAVVLVTQEGGPESPSVVTAKLANLAYATYLKFHPDGMDYFEAGDDGVPYFVDFDGVGCETRHHLIRPRRVAMRYSDLTQLVGTTVS